MQALDEWPEDVALKHRAVLCLASTGATAQAAAQFERHFAGLAVEALDPVLALDIATLRARLLKDAALAATGSERRPALVAAAAAYGAAYRAANDAGLREAYYPGINCATMHLIAGEAATAAAQAREILDALAAWPDAAKGYYEFATEAEARLILGDTAGARAAAHQMRGNRLGDSANYRDLASTIRQLRRIAEARHLDAAWLAELAPPRVIHYAGHIIAAGDSGRFPARKEREVAAAIAAALDAADIGFGYGSLAAGADILFAEALLARGAHLDVVLPFARDEFIEVSVRPAGSAWVKRFQACLDRAATVRYATEEGHLGDDFLFGYCGELAMGLAVLRARHLATSVEQIAVWDGRWADAPAGTAHDIAIWRRAGLPQRVIPVATAMPQASPPPPRAADAGMPRRRPCAMLFADVKAFSVLSDEQLPRFIEIFLGAFARVIDRFSDDILFANTWGDGLFLVFGNAGDAARCALALQREAAAIDRVGAGLPGTLGLRIGGHLGPAYAARDPILRRGNFFGSHVSRTARIEPVTPENCIYVTETLAAALTLQNPDEFQCNYVGMTDAAKRYGKMRMFLLDAASADRDRS
jgi:class 3 adenylate cyclase